MKQIRVTVDKETGKVIWDYDGFVGDECFAEADKLKKLLKEKFGLDVDYEEVHEKPEAYATAEQHEEVKAW